MSDFSDEGFDPADVPESEGPPPAPPGATQSSPADGGPSASAGGDSDFVFDEGAEGQNLDIDPLDVFAAVEAERDSYLDALRRTQADFENYRKRVQREMSDARSSGASSLAEKLVDVLDVVDYALDHDPSDSVGQIASKLNEVLLKEGLERIDAAGAPFDPELHDAVLHEDGDGTAEVIEVLRSGWRWNGRVLRAAMVKVKGN